jgi:hypothetical protein
MSATAAEPRPVGQNCDLAGPPPEAGEEGGHGFVLLVYPRTKDIGPQYSGCQAVFVTSGVEPTRFAWVVEVVEGDPVRMWSPDEDMKDVLSCRYRAGRLQRGDPNVCPFQSLLLPTQPAGCFTKSDRDEKCVHDSEWTPNPSVKGTGLRPASYVER